LYVDKHFHHNCTTGIHPRTPLVTTADPQATTWTSAFTVSMAATANLPWSCMANRSTPHWQISPPSNSHMHLPTSQQQLSMESSPASTTDFGALSSYMMTSPTEWLASSTTCSQRAKILTACSNKSGGYATDLLSYMARTHGASPRHS
jgi:hypothetical protein